MAQQELLKSISSTDKDGKKVSYSVEEIENGWILSQDVSYTDKKGNYKYKIVKKYFTENPLDEAAIKLDKDVARAAIAATNY